MVPPKVFVKLPQPLRFQKRRQLSVLKKSAPFTKRSPLPQEQASVEREKENAHGERLDSRKVAEIQIVCAERIRCGSVADKRTTHTQRQRHTIRGRRHHRICTALQHPTIALCLSMVSQSPPHTATYKRTEWWKILSTHAQPHSNTRQSFSTSHRLTTV